MQRRKFSKELEQWAKADNIKTLGGLIDEFSRDGFAIIILLLMALPALPVPTGGLTHVFEIITMLLGLELIIGRTTIWLPKKWRAKSLASFAEAKMLRKLISLIRWFERFTRPRLAGMMASRHFISIIGVFIFGFTLAAFLAPPFSGLDTLPSLGVVTLSLALIFSDVALFVLGIVVGVMGIVLTIALGSALYKLF